MKIASELSPDQLYRTVDPQTLPLQTSTARSPSVSIVGQPRAVAALRFGLGIRDGGYHVCVTGRPGIGKMTAVRAFVADFARAKAVPCDWCYANNFDDSYQPRVYQLPPGRGRKLQQDLQHVITQVRQQMTKAFESEAYISRRDEISTALNQQREALLAQIHDHALNEGFMIKMTPMGIAIFPAANGVPLKDVEFEALPEESRADLLKRRERLQEEVEHTLKQGHGLELAAQEQLQTLDKQVALSVVSQAFDPLLQQYSDLPDIVAYLVLVQNDILEHRAIFQGQNTTPPSGAEGLALSNPWLQELPFRKYQVNSLVDTSRETGAPVIVELNPTYANLFGRIEKEAVFGALSTDFTLIKGGALHQANGGYLVLPIDDLLRNPFSWDALKRALRTQQIEIEDIGERLGFVTTKSLRPQPIPLTVKVVLVGTPLLYELLQAYDETFPELFKVRADFDTSMPNTPENITGVISFIGAFCANQQFKQLDSAATARLLEHAARLAEHQQKLSAHFGALADLIREAHYWAEQEGAALIGAAHVRQAIHEKLYRSNLIQEHVQELIVKGTLLIDTAGAQIGQVNGLSVISLGDHAFGRPSRITASVAPGRGDIVDIEREVKLGGPIHSKGVLILSGYLAALYAHDQPLILSARLVFEQSYDGIEGDSASSAELYALLSALADVPIKQGIAVTGSVNQHGEIQAIGGINEKIEGFFDICQARGLTGDQGVLMPRSNLEHLMLRDDVIEAVRAGQFHIWAVTTIAEGIEILTGMPAGARRFDGEFPAGSLNERVGRRLHAFASAIHGLSEANGVKPTLH